MAIEIEHKFLLLNDSWRDEVASACHYQQGYMTSHSTSSIRIRTANENAWINIKSATIGNQRYEYEYSIPLHDAQELLSTLCLKPLIEKTRYLVHYPPHTWEIDEFHGENDGLIVAEIELSSATENFHRPVWLGEEVTHDLRYYNNNLARNPYKNWNNSQ